MKIGVVVDNELNNDVRVLREIAILRELGAEIFVLCFGYGKKYKTPIDGINITRINVHKKVRNVLFFFLNAIPVYEWMWASHIKKFISLNEIDILHVHDLYMAKAAHTGIKKSLKEIPIILDLHENYAYAVTTYNWTKGFFRRLISRPYEWQKKEKEYLGYACGIIVLSYDFRDVLLNRYPELSEVTFTVLPNVPDLSRYKQIIRKTIKNPFSQNFPILFYYGVIAERRGVFDALTVFNDLVKENYSVNFLLIGPVDKKDKTRFLEMIHMDSLLNRIHYIPWIDSNELPAYLEIVNICLAPFHKNPQHESGVANKIYDYMLGKKPVIASECKPQQKLIERNECGIIFKSSKEFKDAIIRLLDDSTLRARMGKNGYEAVIKEYNTGMVKENLILLYKTINCNPEK